MFDPDPDPELSVTQGKPLKRLWESIARALAPG
jgi:hypothetical protein